MKIKKAFVRFFSTYKFDSVLFRNFIQLLVITFLILATVSGVLYYAMIIKAKEEAISANENEANRVADFTEMVLKEAKSVAVNLAADNDIILYMMTDRVGEDMDVRIKHKIMSYKNIVNNIDSISIYIQRSNRFIGDTSIYNENDMFEMLSIFKKDAKDGFMIIPRYNDKGNLSAIMLALGVDRIGATGVIFVNVNIYLVDNVITGLLSDYTNFYILTEDNDVLHKTGVIDKSKDIENKYISENARKAFSGFVKTAQGQFAISKLRISQYIDCKFVSVTYQHEYKLRIRAIGSVVLFILVGFLIISIIISFMISMSMFEPISNLITLVDSTKESVNVSNLKNNEIKYVASKIISFMDNNEELKNELSRRIEERKELQFHALQMQINPHFLNNTLNMIGLLTMDKIGVKNEISQSISMLTRLIRYVFNIDNMMVSIDEELANLKIYVQLLKKRYDNFELYVHADEEVKKCKIIRMILQPIIENAVFHGASPKNSNTTIVVEIHIVKDYMHIKIKDDGIGIDENKLEEICNELMNDKIVNNHVGIKNVYQRLKLAYGERFKFAIDSKVGEYTAIFIDIPLEI